MNILIEGWRGINHSYALVNQLSKQSDQPSKKIIALHSGGLAGIKGFEQRYKLSIFPE